MKLEDQVFLDPSIKTAEVWRVILNGKLLPIEWNSKGAALAGLEVERRRQKGKC